MKSTETVVIGGGQAGLAMSRSLRDRGRDHVVLERGRIAERWRSERWDSLRLLTPNWMSRLPGYAYRGPDPDGFMGKADVIEFLRGYARSFDAPVEEETTVTAVTPHGDGWRVETDRGTWKAKYVVVATGHCDKPNVPALADALDPDIFQMTTTRYRGPDSLPSGGVLVVGASATGAQLADELRRSGRQVTLAVGRHNRLPRAYRGRDIMWWLDRIGVLDRTVDELPEPDAGIREPSLQLVGQRPGSRREIGLDALHANGVRIVGRTTAATGSRVHLEPDFQRHIIDADQRLTRVLSRIEHYAGERDLELGPAETIAPVSIPGPGPESLDLHGEGIRSVLWATGYRRVYPWLNAPALDTNGEIVQRRGRTPLPGLYVLGIQFMIRRRSSFIDGVGRDAEEIADDIICEECQKRWAA